MHYPRLLIDYGYGRRLSEKLRGLPGIDFQFVKPYDENYSTTAISEAANTDLTKSNHDMF